MLRESRLSPCTTTLAENQHKKRKKEQRQMEEGGVRQPICSKLVKETQITAAERCRKGMTKREREADPNLPHMYTLT